MIKLPSVFTWEGNMQNTPAVNLVLLFARICVAILFLVAAYNKMKGYNFFVGYFTKLGIPMPAISTPIIIAIETLGGLAMLVGYKVRIAGPVLALFSIVAGLYAHSNFADPNHFNHFLKNIGLFGTIALFYATGAGAYAVDKKG
jgi:putative oxidoreductase